MKVIYKDGHVDECPQEEELHVIRHTAAHVMAQAITHHAVHKPKRQHADKRDQHPLHPGSAVSTALPFTVFELSQVSPR